MRRFVQKALLLLETGQRDASIITFFLTDVSNAAGTTLAPPPVRHILVTRLRLAVGGRRHVTGRIHAAGGAPRARCGRSYVVRKYRQESK